MRLCIFEEVIDAAKAVLETTNYVYATSQFAQAALRDVTGNSETGRFAFEKEEISGQIKGNC